MPDLILQQTSPYGTRRASLLRGDGDAYLYVEDVLNPESATTSAVWVANHMPAPNGRGEESPPGVPPRMGAGGTRHPEGCPPLGDRLELVWFEEGDAVVLTDGEGVLAAVPGWGGRSEFYGYSRYARGRCPLAWELTRQASTALDLKVTESREFWRWRSNSAWPEIRSIGLAHLDSHIGPQEAAWPLGQSAFPELIATRHRYADQPVWVTATTGLSAQRMAGVEQYVDDPDAASRIELAIARTVPDQSGAELLSTLATIPFDRAPGSVRDTPSAGPLAPTRPLAPTGRRCC